MNASNRALLVFCQIWQEDEVKSLVSQQMLPLFLMIYLD